MSEMLRINSNAYVRKSCIEVVEQEGDEVFVYTSTSKFKSDIALWQIINMVDLDKIEVKQEAEHKENMDIDLTNQFVSL